MDVGWLVDAEMFDHYRDALVDAVKECGYRAELVTAPSPPYRWDDVGPRYEESFPEGHCVVAHGDIEFVMRVRASNRWTPGAFCDVEKYLWSRYATHYEDLLLNAEYEMLPFGQLRSSSDSLFRRHGAGDAFFVHPDSPLKLFTGQVVRRETFDADLEFMAFYDVPDDAVVVVSSPKRVEREWRFVVADRRVVAGCEYKQGDQFGARPGYDDDAHRLAQHAASGAYQPERVWVVDVCRTDAAEYRIVEIGGFSFADLYACEMSDVVSAVSDAALSEWNRLSDA